MAWIYLAVLEESVLLCRPGSDRSLTVKTTDTRKAFFCPECSTEPYPADLFGTIFELLPATCCLPSTSSMEGSLVRISALQELATAWRESEVVYFSKYYESLKKQKHRSSFLKTSLVFGQEVSTLSSKSFPAEGMTVDGRLYPLPKLGHHTFENVGSYLPTPTAQSYGSNQGGGAGRRGKVRKSLSTMAKERGGKLNPNFVEWMMGYPIGWTVLEDWVMQWFQNKQEKRSKG